MTTITIERQTLERAMAALVYHQEQTRPIERTRIVIEELIAALAAQQAEPQEPVAYVLDGMAYMRAELDGEAVNAASPLYAAQPAPAAVPPDERIRVLREALEVAIQWGSALTQDEIARCRAALKATQ